MKSKRFFRLTLQIICFSMTGLLAISTVAASGSEYQDAIDAAMQWMDLVDNGNYQDSWDQASSYFKSAVLKDDWKRIIEAVRSPLGNVVSRKFKSQQYTTSLPGVPDGEYLVIQFDTSFANKKSAIETITPAKDSDGQWRVSGYYIK